MIWITSRHKHGLNTGLVHYSDLQYVPVLFFQTWIKPACLTVAPRAWLWWDLFNNLKSLFTWHWVMVPWFFNPLKAMRWVKNIQWGSKYQMPDNRKHLIIGLLQVQYMQTLESRCILVVVARELLFPLLQFSPLWNITFSLKQPVISPSIP